MANSGTFAKIQLENLLFFVKFIMQYIVCLAYIAFFIFLICKLNFFKVEGLSPQTLSALFILKIAAGTMLWAIYTYYYTNRTTADIFKYFDDSKVLHDTLFKSPKDYFKMLFAINNDTPYFARYYDQMNNWYNRLNSNLYNDSHTIIRMNAVMRLFSLGYFHVHTVFICFLSMLGLTGIYHFYVDEMRGKIKILIVCIYLTPSVILWSSGMLKEAVIVTFLGLLLYSLKKALKKEALLASAVLICLSVFLLFVTKFYILVALAPALVAFIWAKNDTNKLVLIKYTAVIVLYLFLGQLIRVFAPAYDPVEVIRIKQKDFLHISTGGIYLKNDSITVFIKSTNKSATHTNDSIHYTINTGKRFNYFKNYQDDSLYAVSKSDTSQFVFLEEVGITSSRIYLPKLKIATPIELLKITPRALKNTVLLTTSSKTHLLETIAIVENWLILFFIGFCLVFRKKLNSINWNYVLFGLCFSLILYLIIGWTTPVTGAIVRYKVPALPFLALSFLELIDINYIKTTLKLQTNT